jgi:hypothetical protein
MTVKVIVQHADLESERAIEVRQVDPRDQALIDQVRLEAGEDAEMFIHAGAQLIVEEAAE